MQQRFCNHANVAVVIVECGKQFLISSNIPAVVPLQMASEQIQRIALSDVLRHFSELALSEHRLDGVDVFNRR